MKNEEIPHNSIKYSYDSLYEESTVSFDEFLNLLHCFVKLNRTQVGEASMGNKDFIFMTDGFKLPRNQNSETFLEMFQKLFIDDREIIIDYVLRYLESLHVGPIYFSNEYNIPPINGSMFDFRPAKY